MLCLCFHSLIKLLIFKKLDEEILLPWGEQEEKDVPNGGEPEYTHGNEPLTTLVVTAIHCGYLTSAMYWGLNKLEGRHTGSCALLSLHPVLSVLSDELLDLYCEDCSTWWGQLWEQRWLGDCPSGTWPGAQCLCWNTGRFIKHSILWESSWCILLTQDRKAIVPLTLISFVTGHRVDQHWIFQQRNYLRPHWECKSVSRLSEATQNQLLTAFVALFISILQTT